MLEFINVCHEVNPVSFTIMNKIVIIVLEAFLLKCFLDFALHLCGHKSLTLFADKDESKSVRLRIHQTGEILALFYGTSGNYEPNRGVGVGNCNICQFSWRLYGGRLAAHGRAQKALALPP